MSGDLEKNPPQEQRALNSRYSISLEISVFLALNVVDALCETNSPYLMALSQEIQVKLAEVA